MLKKTDTVMDLNSISTNEKSSFREEIRRGLARLPIQVGRFPKWVRTKIIFQDWLEKIPFTHMVTIECDKKNEMSEDELKQRLRIIDYKLNKKYMICKFGKLPLEKRIFSIGFIEKSKKKGTKTIHAHILFYLPEYEIGFSGYSKKISPFKSKFVALNIISSWLSIPSLKRNGKYRKLKSPHIMGISNDRKSPVRYASKQVEKDFESMFYNFGGFDINNTRILEN